MSSYRRTIPLSEIPFNVPGAIADRRTQVLERELELKEERRKRLDEQTSPSNSPEARIQIWERMHALPYPRTPDHKLVFIVAEQTDLTVAQVRDEQARRAGAVTPLAG
jgi:hypothetical protein